MWGWKSTQSDFMTHKGEKSVLRKIKLKGEKEKKELGLGEVHFNKVSPRS